MTVATIKLMNGSQVVATLEGVDVSFNGPDVSFDYEGPASSIEAHKEGRMLFRQPIIGESPYALASVEYSETPPEIEEVI